MGKHAALADEPEPGKLLDQRGPDRCALADQRQGLGVLEPRGERVDVLRVVVPDGDLMAGDLGEARERPDRVLVVVEDRDVHGPRA
jgi:hypothetical protein